MKVRRSHIRTGILALLAAALLFPFQNCTRIVHSSTGDQQSNFGGPGTDGMKFLTYGTCPNGKVDVYSAITVAGDLSSALLTRNSCQDLVNPQVVSLSTSNYLNNSPVAFVVNGRIFDAQTGAPDQRVTVLACQDSLTAPTVQASVWENAGNNALLFGSVSQVAGPSTGDLKVTMPGYQAPNDFVSASGQPSAFQLLLENASSASLTYTFASSPQVSAPPLTCLTQNLPPPPASPYSDGATGAPLGAPQAPSEFGAYSVRPSWRVAGVDYPVGVPAGTVLKDPTLLSMPGVVVDTALKVIIINASNVTLDGYDFSLHGGYSVEIGSGNNTIVRNSVVSLVQTDSGAGGLTVENCVLDGGGATSDSYALIYHMGTGPLVAQYNWFKNYPAKGVQIASGPTVAVKYNLFQNGGMKGLTQENYVSSGTFTAFAFDYNTIDQPLETDQVGSAISLNGGPISFTNTEIGYNSIVAHGTSTNSSLQAVIAIGPGTVTPTTDSATIHDNFIDPTGTSMGAFFPGLGTPLIVYSNNINLATGLQLPTNP